METGLKNRKETINKPRGRSESILARLGLPLVIPSLIVLAWWAGSGSAVVPTFGEVFYVLFHPFETPKDLYSRSLAFSLMITLLRLGLGFGLGVLTAVPAGLLAGRYLPVRRLLEPVVAMARPINPIVLLPIATVLFGLSSVASLFVGAEEAWRHDIWDQVGLAMVAILWWGAFFPVFVSTVHGVGKVKTAYVETLRLMGGSDKSVFVHVTIPHALPDILSGMRTALGVSWLVLIAAEVFPGVRSGLGYMLCVACKTSDYHYTFAAIITIGITGLFSDMLLGRAERNVSHWSARL